MFLREQLWKGIYTVTRWVYLGSFIWRVDLRRQQYLFSIAQVFVLTTHNHKVNIKQRIIEDRILTTKTYQTTYGGISVQRNYMGTQVILLIPLLPKIKVWDKNRLNLQILLKNQYLNKMLHFLNHHISAILRFLLVEKDYLSYRHFKTMV